MPDPGFDRMQESMKFVGATSYGGDPIYFGPNKTRPLPGEGSPLSCASDSDESGKTVVVKGVTDVSSVNGTELMNVASPQSPIGFSPNVTGPLPGELIPSIDQHPCYQFLNVDLDQDDRSLHSSELATDSSSPTQEPRSANSSISEYDEAQDDVDEDTTAVSEVLPMPMRSPAMNESDPWRDIQELRLFEDTLEQADISSGLGFHECVRLMGLPEEPEHDANPSEVVQEPEEMLIPSTPIVTFQVPGFSISLAGGIVPFAELQSVEDPDNVGLENLDIFMNP